MSAKVQKAILDSLYNGIENLDWSGQVDENDLKEDILDQHPDIDESDVDYNITRLADNYCIHRSPLSGGNAIIEPTAQTVDQLDQLGGETIISRGTVRDVLEVFYDEERENPRNPQVQRDELHDRLDSDDNEIDLTVWYLNEKHWIDALTYLGATRYNGAKIEEAGRSVIERF
jgi:hypothetical protein